MKKILLIVCALGALNGFAQKGAKPEAYGKTITPADLRKHLFIVASAEMEGRETASPGQRRAAEYIETQFRSFGLQPGTTGGYQQLFNVYQDSLLSSRVEVNGQAFELDKDFSPNVAQNINATMRFGEVVFLGANAPVDSVRNMNLAGRVVMITGTPPMGRQPAGGNSLFSVLSTKGMAALLMVQNNFPRTTATNRKGRQYVNAFNRSVAPQQFGISETIAKTIAGQGWDAAKANNAAIQIFPAELTLELQKSSVSAQSSNVVGVLPGTDLKDEYLFITAHYDHLGKQGNTIY